MQTGIRYLWLLALTACVATPAPQAGEATVSPSPLSAASPSPKSVTPVPTVAQESTPTAVPPTTRVTISPSRVNSPPLCTPLEDHPLDELGEILTNPFEAPRPGRDDGHHGVDFSYYTRGERDTIQGVVVQSLLAGKVAAVVADRPPYGFMLIVETPGDDLPSELGSWPGKAPGQSVYVLYAHLDGLPLVEFGDTISCGQDLGLVGNSGWSGNPHLHLEIRTGPMDTRFLSMAYYDTRATESEMENYRLWRMSGQFVPVDPMTLLK